MAEARKRRELLPLVYQHLLQAGYVRAAREVKEQSGQKSFLAQPVTLLEIYTHWQLTSEVGQKRKAEEDAALQAKRTRVSDPASSSESSEEEEEEAEAETPRTTPRLSLTNSLASRTVLSASLKEKTPTKKTNIMVNSVALPSSGKTVAQLLSGKSPRKSSGPSADTILVSETEEEGSMQTVSTTVQPGVTTVVQSSSSSDNTSSSSDETDIEVKPSVNATQTKASPASTKVSSGKKAASTPGKAAMTPPVQLSTVSRTKKQEEDSESTEESESEGLPVATLSQKVLQPSEKTGQVRGSLGLVKGTPSRGTVPTAPGKAGRPEEDSESSSEESDSEEEDETRTTKAPPQAQPSRKSIQVQVASRLAKESPQKRTPPAPTGRTKPAGGQAQQQQQQEEDSSSDERHSRRASSTARVPPAQAKFVGKSPQSRENTGLPEKRAAPSVGKKEEDSESSSEESDDEGATSTAGTLAQAKPLVTTPQVRFAPVPTKSSQQRQESSTESSDSEEEAAAPTPAQAKPALKTPPAKVSPRKITPATPPPSTVRTARVGTPAPWRGGTLASPAVTKDTQKAEEDSSSSEESESEEETAATAVGQVQSVRKSLPTKAALMPTKGASAQVTTPVLPRKAGPSATQTRTEMSEDSSSSEEESDSKEAAKTPPQAKASVKTPQTKTTPASSPRAALPKGATASRKTITAAAQAKPESPVKMKPTAKTPQSSALPTRSPVCVQAASKGVVATAQAPSAPVVAEEESDSSEGEAPTSVKPPGMNSQVRTASVPAKGSPRERAGPASTAKAGPTATQGERHQEDSESSSEESDSEEEATGNAIQKEDNSKTSKRKSPASVTQKKSPKESSESSDELPASQVIKLPLIFVDPNRSPAASARTQAAGSPRKARASESTARSSSSESEDEDMIPATQCSVPAINLSMVSEPTTPTRSTPKTTVSGTSSTKTSSRIVDGKKQQAAGTQVTKKKQTSLLLTQAALKVLSQKASEAQSPAARTPSSAGVDSAPRTHPGTTSHGTPTQASVTAKSRKAEVPAISQAFTSSSDSDSSSGSSSENEEEKQGPQRTHSASSLGAASSRDTIVEETSAEVSEDKIRAPSQSLLSGGVIPQPTSATSHPSKANPRSDPSALGSSTVVTKDASNGKQRAEPQHATTVISPKAGNKESGTTSQIPRKPKKPKKGSLSSQASVAALKSDIEQRLLSELWPLSETQVQASVVKMLAELLDQEKRKALEVTKDSDGRSGLKRKLQGDQATTKVPEKKKKKKQLEAREGGESAVTPEKNLRTAKGKPKKDRPSGDLKKKKKKKKKAGSGSQETKEKPEGVQGQTIVEGASSKDKKEKRKSNKKTKDKEKKEKKKAKKASTKDSSLQLQKKKKKKKKTEQPV